MSCGARIVEISQEDDATYHSSPMVLGWVGPTPNLPYACTIQRILAKNHIESENGEGLYILTSNKDNREQCPGTKNNVMNSNWRIILNALVPARFSI